MLCCAYWAFPRILLTAKPTSKHHALSPSSMEKSVDGTTIIMVGGTIYLVGCAGLITDWNSHQTISTLSAVISSLGLLVTCVGILMIDNYRFLKAFALMGILLISAFGLAWIAP